MDPINLERFSTQDSKFTIPEELAHVIEAEKALNHFRILGEIEKELVSTMPQFPIDPYTAPELIKPKLNLGGYSASAITEGLRNRSISSRIVYGHLNKEGVGVLAYHYWTEVVTDDDRKIEIDGTYGQIDPKVKDKILIYSFWDLPKYNLKEVRPSDNFKFILTTDGTASFLKNNDGMLPVREEIKNNRVLELYEELVKNFS